MPEPAPLFHEEQRFRQTRVRFLTAIPPVAMLLLAIWQVGMGHKWGKNPMSNGALTGWTVFIWLIYLRLITVKLVTEVRPGELLVAMRGMWRSHRIYLAGVQSARVMEFDPVRDWGGYGIRSKREGTAYIAGGRNGVQLDLIKGGILLIGSQRSTELCAAISRQLTS